MKDDQLIGKCFVIWGTGREVNYQGEIVGRPEPGIYLARYFDFVTGSESTFALYPIAEMRAGRDEGCFEFFEDDAHLRDWMANTYQRPID